MTLKLYHEDSYLDKFSAKVSQHDLDNHGLILDQTAFYPGGGGQPNDKGKFSLPIRSNIYRKSKNCQSARSSIFYHLKYHCQKLVQS